MNRKMVFIGILIGVLVPILIALAFIAFFINHNVVEGYQTLSLRGKLPNVLRIGLLGNLTVFIFTYRNKELVARGLVIATLLLLIITLVL
ncbi:MAG: hypothetical protein EOO51_01545 [Flavobacterium sp.]|nr:MAG: hypothetical protein EOO51_01545 [Flavobacterium sp.]